MSPRQPASENTAPAVGRCALAFVLLICQLISIPDSHAQTRNARGATDQTLVLLMDQAPLGEVVEAIARRTGNHYIYESPLPGRVTVAVPARVSAAEATEILNAALLLKGMVAIPIAANQHKIVRWEKMAGSAPYTEAALSAEVEHSVTTRLALRYADPDIVARTLQPMLQSGGQVIPYAPANSLIFAGTENRIHRLMELARLMDKSHEESLVVLRLRYRNAGEVKKQLDALLQQDRRSGGRPHTIEFSVDERTNALLLIGPDSEIARLREWILRIDVPAAGTGELHIVHLIHRDPEDLSRLLNGFASASGRVATGASAIASAGPLVGRDYNVASYPATRSLVIRSDRETFDTLRQLIAKLDIEPRMVRVDIEIYEISIEGSLGLGIGAAIPFIEPTPTKIYGALINPALLPIEIPGFAPVPGSLGAPLLQLSGTDAVPGLGISLIARESRAESKLLQNPSITLQVGEESELFVGDNIPIPVETINTDDTDNLSLGPTLNTTIQRQDVGTLIRVKALLNSDDTLQLELHFENTLVRGVIDPSIGAILSNRSIDATFTAGFGKRMIIAGLSGEVRGKRGSGIPFISQIPVIGTLTTANLDTHRKIYMFVSIQAQLLPTTEERQASVAALSRAAERLALDLAPGDGARYMVLAASYYKRRVAEIAEELLLPEVDPWPMLIVPRESDKGQRFDLYVLGLKTISEVAQVTLTLEQAGMAPEIVPLALAHSAQQISNR